jgi:DNA (cytosine-5)-methyltransferase 1
MRRPLFFSIDFFCGAGGTTRGLIDAGGYVLAGVDKDERCRETFISNNPNLTGDCRAPRFLHRDIFPRRPDYPQGQKKQLTEELDQLVAWHRRWWPRIPMLFAICAPCQPFTRLSRKALSEKRKVGREKDRDLLREAATFVARYRPEMVLSENVSGIKDPKYGGVWDKFRDRLEALGYATGSKIVCTSRFGIAQYRKRSMLIAVRRELVRPERFADLLQKELVVPEADSDEPIKTVIEAIGHLPRIKAGVTHKLVPNHRTRTLSDLNLLRLGSAKPGESNIYMESTEHGDLSLDCHRKVNARLDDRCFTDVYTRMRPDRPSPTITTKCHSISNGRFGHYDMKQVRGISLREAAALQSFRDDYIFYPTNQIEPVARMIGNAVPPKLAQFFASYLAQTLSPRLRRESKARSR